MSKKRTAGSGWSEEEKQLLVRSAVANTNSAKQIVWERVQKDFPHRTASQLKTFFSVFVKPTLDPGLFKRNEYWDSTKDRLLCELVRQHGKKWKTIMQFIDGRSPQQLKLRYFYL